MGDVSNHSNYFTLQEGFANIKEVLAELEKAKNVITYLFIKDSDPWISNRYLHFQNPTKAKIWLTLKEKEIK